MAKQVRIMKAEVDSKEKNGKSEVHENGKVNETPENGIKTEE